MSYTPDAGPPVVRFPQMRQNLIGCLQEFADPEFQRRRWVDRVIPAGRVASFDHTVGELFDMLRIDDGDQTQFIGSWLLNEREAEAMTAFAAAFDRFWDPLEPGLSDAELVARPDWSQVVDAARATLGVVAPTVGWTVED